PTGKLPLEGGQVVVGGSSAGRVTSARRSAELDKVIGLAILPHWLAVDGGEFDVVVGGGGVSMRVPLGPFFDPAGEGPETGRGRRSCREIGAGAALPRGGRDVRGARRLARPRVRAR